MHRYDSLVFWRCEWVTVQVQDFLSPICTVARYSTVCGRCRWWMMTFEWDPSTPDTGRQYYHLCLQRLVWSKGREYSILLTRRDTACLPLFVLPQSVATVLGAFPLRKTPRVGWTWLALQNPFAVSIWYVPCCRLRNTTHHSPQTQTSSGCGTHRHQASADNTHSSWWDWSVCRHSSFSPYTRLFLQWVELPREYSSPGSDTDNSRCWSLWRMCLWCDDSVSQPIHFHRNTVFFNRIVKDEHAVFRFNPTYRWLDQRPQFLWPIISPWQEASNLIMGECPIYCWRQASCSHCRKWGNQIVRIQIEQGNVHMGQEKYEILLPSYQNITYPKIPINSSA